jgi:AraC-like DNA-binding protein
VDSIRSQLAHEYLAQAHYKIKDVASMLGFADVRAFQRRFRHWTGVSPSQYKKSLNQPGGSASE